MSAARVCGCGLSRPAPATSLARHALRLLGLLFAWPLLSGPTPAVAAATTMESFTTMTLPQFWAGFDPRREPLQLEVTKAWEEGGVRYEQIFFTPETWQGEAVRMFAYRGVPAAASAAASVPAILHIHGGGQTAMLDWVRFWTARGYACLSIDYGGKRQDIGPDRTTHWGKVRGDMAGMKVVDLNVDTPRDVEWYHWAIGARRALTVLEQTAGVDGQRLGVFGISMGGTLTWIVSGTDARVKAAAPIYGAGWGSYPELDNGDVTRDPNLYLRRALLEAEVYAPTVTCPLLYLDAANDFWGRLDYSMRTLANCGSPELRMAYTPQYLHYIGPREAANLPLWMDWHLKGKGAPWPQTPALAIEAGTEGQARIRVTPAAAGEVERVEVHYGLNTPRAPQRYYRPAVAERTGDTWTAAAPTISPTDVLFAYANVSYHSGITLSTRLERREARMLPGVRPTLRPTALIDAMDNDAAWFVRYAETDPWHTVTYFKPRSTAGRTGLGPLVDTAATSPSQQQAFYFATLKLSDPQWHERGSAPLLIDVAEDARPLALKLEARTHFAQGDEAQYNAVLQPRAGTGGTPGWSTYQILPGELKKQDGAALQNWDEVDFLNFGADWAGLTPPAFSNLRWQR